MKSQFLFTIVLLCQLVCPAFVVDLSQHNKYGNSSILDTLCNKNTQIDFTFSSSSFMSCSTSSCSLKDGPLSTLKFLDVTGDDLDLTLESAQFTSDSLVDGRTTPSFAFIFADLSSQKKVFVIIPVQFTDSMLNYVINVNNVNQNQFQTFKNLNTVRSQFPLSAFNFMNLRDFGHFYHITNSQRTQTILISSWTYYLSNDFGSEGFASSLPTFVPAYSQTGDKLCFGALETQGIFETHLRESFPLWTAWFALLFFWLYYLLTQTNTSANCINESFANNKMTCWGFYSLHFLGHDEYFTKLSRISLMMFNFSLQALILAALYMTTGPLVHNVIIFWSAIIAFFATWPFPFLFGCTFLSSISETTIEKFEKIKKSKSMVLERQENEEKMQQQIDDKQEKLYGLYYWYYVIIFISFVVFWTVAIHLMQQLHRDFYYLHYYWLASLAITFVFDHLIFDPLFSCLFGETKFYQSRGYYYNYKLGEEYKEIEL